MPTTVRPRRSALYVPGSNKRALEKAKELAADVLLLDLEDAVAPEAKESARANVLAILGEKAAFGERELVVRANGLDTPGAMPICAHSPPQAPMPFCCPRSRAAMQSTGCLPCSPRPVRLRAFRFGA